MGAVLSLRHNAMQFYATPEGAAMKSNPSVLALLFSVSMTLAAEAIAATLVLEEVVVTARKQHNVAHDVPISLVVTDGQRIQDLTISKLNDLSSYIPNVHIGEAGVSSQLFIRGVGSGVNQGFEQSVGTYVDGVYYGRGQLSRSPFFDLERVEVLRGPQSTLFGKNTSAGALSIITASPTQTSSASFSVLYETEHEEKKIDGFVNGELSDNFAGRVAFRVSENDGWLKNGNQGKSDEPASEEQTIRLGLSYEGMEDMTAVAKLSWASFETNGRQQQALICSDIHLGRLTANSFYDDCSKDDNKWDSGHFVPATNTGPGFDFGDQGAETQSLSASLLLEYQFGNFIVSNLSGFNTYDYDERTDTDYSALSFIGVEVVEDFQQWSNETRLRYAASDNSQWLFGFYAQRVKMDNQANSHWSFLEVAGFPPLSSTTFNTFDQDTNSWAVFSEWQYHFSEHWSVTIGARFTEEDKDVKKVQINAELGGTVASTDPAITATFNSFGIIDHNLEKNRSESSFTPSAYIQYQPSDQRHYYASVSKGFKGGGFDSIHYSGDPDSFEYEDESVIAYELGAKFRLLDNQAALQVALFLSDFTDLQFSTLIDNGFSVGNAAKVRSQGVEMEFRIRLSAELSAGLNYAYLDSRYKDFDKAPCYREQSVELGCVASVRSLSGESTQFSPKHSGTLFLDYSVPIKNNTLSAQLAIQYTDDYAVAADLDPRLEQSGFSKIDLRIAYELERWELAFIGKNLTDETTSSWANDMFFSGASYFIFTDRTRSTALQLTYRY